MPEDFLYYWDGPGVFKSDYLWIWQLDDDPLERESKDAFACYCMMSI
jgi:hypothetical protein